ncbi:MAG: hypothetical protein MRZ79_24360 [Bacteroidia bacterium]|nr:hypothetical protein [Bacteroidia bacterium]
MTSRFSKTILLGLLLFSSGTLWAQEMDHGSSSNLQIGFGLLELPFLILCVVFAFLTARELRGGKLGRGMTLLAWGFLIMAVGHLHMQIDHIFQLNIFQVLMGEPIATIAWYLTLVFTWGLSGYGFYLIYKASSS